MKKRTHLHTNFVKFIVEKYKKEVQELPNEESKVLNHELEDEFDEIMNDKETSTDKSTKVSTESEDENDNQDIDTLLKEYLTLEKKYKLKRNDSLFKRK